ncbi:hypothetical protein Bca52824_041414 [Brassica carinata]|uniref:Subtilisin-like protease n=1 Tax=Brassica carinata TaxID=52824 RepID=A0A8X7RXC6_BRACI|nr:hypothetical protein Bca52824_041414 [Brassica carinata]
MNETTESRPRATPTATDPHRLDLRRTLRFPASVLGYARGVASGMAPKARLAAYKVCWNSGCYDSDILAAFDTAVADGVDVVSLSVGGVVVPYYLDAIAIGAFGAVDRGIFVSASAGNGGPGALTVTNVAPWMTTVGAGTIDRDFPANVKLGNGKTFTRRRRLLFVSVYRRLVGSEFGERKIVLCDRGINSRATKGEIVRRNGGSGMIIANGVFDGEGLVADCHVLPATSVGASGGDEIRADCDGARRAGHVGNLNYPSFSVVFQQYGESKMSTHFIRTVTNVGDSDSVYEVKIRPPRGTNVTVEPERLSFRRVGQKLSFVVRVKTTEVRLSPGATSVETGHIVWSDGKRNVTSPLVVTLQQPL